MHQDVSSWKLLPGGNLLLVSHWFHHQVKVFERGTGEDDGPEVAFHNEKRMLQLLKPKTSENMEDFDFGHIFLSKI